MFNMPLDDSVTRGSMKRVFKSKVFRVMPSSEAVRTSIPEAVATVLGVEHGSTLLWTVDSESGKVTVSK